MTETGSHRSIGIGEAARYAWTLLPHAPTPMRCKRRYGERYHGWYHRKRRPQSCLHLARAIRPIASWMCALALSRRASIQPCALAMRPGDDALDFTFDEIGGGPLVYISLGTMSNVHPLFFRSACEAFAGYPARFILAVGQQASVADLGPITAHFAVRRYALPLALLQRTGIHHAWRHDQRA